MRQKYTVMVDTMLDEQGIRFVEDDIRKAMIDFGLMGVTSVQNTWVEVLAEGDRTSLEAFYREVDAMSSVDEIRGSE